MCNEVLIFMYLVFSARSHVAHSTSRSSVFQGAYNIHTNILNKNFIVSIYNNKKYIAV